VQAHTAPVSCIRALARAGQRATQIASSGAFPDVGFQARGARDLAAPAVKGSMRGLRCTVAQGLG